MGELYSTDGSKLEWPQYEESYFSQEQYYPELNIITQNYDNIYKEFIDFHKKDPTIWHDWIDNKLSVVPIYFYGKWSRLAKVYFPKLYSLFEPIKDKVTINYSCLKPQSHIPPHQGWGNLANHVLRCHFGMQVPINCGCICNHYVMMHKTREWLVFDDAKMHSSFNYSDEHRYILIVDMKRPDALGIGDCKLAYSTDLYKMIAEFYDEKNVI
jgi:aspartyl/asparaginyl beta-hydroxylase (cupin superfamily)